MSWKEYPIYKREDGSFVIVVNDAPYHVPNESVWTDMYEEVSKFYASEEAVKADVEFQYIDLHPELLPESEPEPSFEELKISALSIIDSATNKAIISGFYHTINGEQLHFSYNIEDQQNFSDTFNAVAMKQLMGVENLPETIDWNGWRNHTSESKGELVVLTLTPNDFLNLYTQGALVHKQTHLEIGKQRKKALENCNTKEDINILITEWKL